MEVNLPTFQPHEIDFDNPGVLAAEFQRANENPPSLFRFLREETERLRNQFIPLNHPNPAIRDAYTQHFDSPGSRQQVKNTLEMIWSSKLECIGEIEVKVDCLERKIRVETLKLEDFKREFDELSMWHKIIKFHFGSQGMFRRFRDKIGVLETLQREVDSLARNDFGYRRLDFQKAKCQTLLTQNNNITITGQFRTFLLQTQLISHLENILELGIARASMLTRLRLINRSIHGWMKCLESELSKVLVETERIGQIGLRAIEIVLNLYDFDLGLELEPDSDEEL